MSNEARDDGLTEKDFADIAKRYGIEYPIIVENICWALDAIRRYRALEKAERGEMTAYSAET